MQLASAPLSRQQLRRYALQIRKALGLEQTMFFPVTEFLERLQVLFPQAGPDYEIVEDHELPYNVHAHYDVDDNVIRIKNSVYVRACLGHGRDRMTIVHEIAHFLLIKQNGLQLTRYFSNEPLPAYRDPEWQAKCLAGELMVPSKSIHGLTPFEIAAQCGVSIDAAVMQQKNQ